MLKMVIRMDDEKSTVKKSTVWREFMTRSTRCSAHLDSQGQRGPLVRWYIGTADGPRISACLEGLSII